MEAKKKPTKIFFFGGGGLDGIMKVKTRNSPKYLEFFLWIFPNEIRNFRLLKCVTNEISGVSGGGIFFEL